MSARHGQTSPSRGTAPRPAVRRLYRLAAAGAVSLAGFVVLETLLRLTDRAVPPPHPVLPEEPDVVEEHPPIGYRLIPGRVFRRVADEGTANERNLVWRSNRHGFRGARELDSPDARTRVAVVGDSYVFGLGVEEHERFTEAMEALRPAWRVDNLGMNGFGADLMLRTVEEVALALEPRALLFCVYTDDFPRVRPQFTGLGYELPRYRVRAGRLESMPYPRRGALGNLRTVQIVRRLHWELSGAEWELHGAILDRLFEVCRRSACAPGLVFLPPRHADLPHDERRRAFLRDRAAAAGVPFADVSAALRRDGADAAFLANDIHWNARGHRIVAQVLCPFVEEEVLAGRR